MAIITTTHLNFRGDARAALEFYQSVFGGQVVSITFGDAHNVQSEGVLRHRTRWTRSCGARSGATTAST